MAKSRLSTRVSLRWPPEPPFENTDTIVLSVGDWYVDLRIDRASGAIDWAIAGERLQDPKSNQVLFTHEIDSRNSFGVPDCGSFSTLSNGDDLEVGVMPRYDLPGLPVRKYEEVWRELSFRSSSGARSRGLSFVLEAGTEGLKLREGEEKEVVRTFVAAISGTYVVLRQSQVLVRPAGEAKIVPKSGGEVSARREEFSGQDGLQVKYAVGHEAANLPSRLDFCSLEHGSPHSGEKLVVRGEEYVIRSFEDSGEDSNPHRAVHQEQN
ncbi:hypothetical protein BJX61DRAFT_202367 [Aspergillus egyptiacus]|nr:hypothetical protein BJX61DRAFT_202367 [Aspergillus egyptiacus]